MPLTERVTGGILEDVSRTVVALDIAEGAHHLDLMFSQPADPLSVKKVWIMLN